jgi:hypothetical protein
VGRVNFVCRMSLINKRPEIKLAHHIRVPKTLTKIKMREQGAEENIWTKEGSRDGRLEETE